MSLMYVKSESHINFNTTNVSQRRRKNQKSGVANTNSNVAGLFLDRDLQIMLAFGKTRFKVHIFRGHKILRNLHLPFVLSSASQKLGEDFAKFCGQLRIYEV